MSQRASVANKGTFDRELSAITLTFELDLDRVKLKQRAKIYVKSFSSKVFSGHTHYTNCSTWTTKVVGNDTTNTFGLYEMLHKNYRSRIIPVVVGRKVSLSCLSLFFTLLRRSGDFLILYNDSITNT